MRVKDNINKDEDFRIKCGITAGLFGIITNFLLFVGKISVGILAGSITIVADAVNNFFDLVSSSMILVSFKFSIKPADRNHPFGHERIEQIMALVISVIVFGVGLFFTERSIEKIIIPDVVKVSAITFAFLGVAVVLKLSQMFLYKNFAKKINSDTLRASAMDSRNDVISSSVVLFAMIFIKIFGDVGVSIDGIFGLFVSILIIISSIKLIVKTISPLLGEMPKKDYVEKLKNEISTYKGILGVYNFVIHSYGPKKFFASVDVEVNAENDILNISQEMDKIEKDFRKKYNIDLSIHIDPVKLDDEETKFLKKKVNVILKNIDEKFVVHDFFVENDEGCAKISFDLVAPFEHKVNLSAIKRELMEKCKEENCTFDINVERG